MQKLQVDTELLKHFTEVGFGFSCGKQLAAFYGVICAWWRWQAIVLLPLLQKIVSGASSSWDMSALIRLYSQGYSA